MPLSDAPTSVDACVPVLTYHSLDESGSVISTAPELFRDQMRTLHQRGFRGISASALLDAWEGRSALPSRSVVLTFDDGYRNVLEHAADLLESLGFRATVFAVPGRCGSDNDWQGQPTRIPRLPLLSWSELRQLASSGFEIGAHTLDHPSLPNCTPGEAEREIIGSKHLLEQRIGHAVTVFAYPYGSASPRDRDTVRRHFRAGFGVDLRLARSADDRYRLPRIDMICFRQPFLYRNLTTPLGRAYLRTRDLVRRFRSAIGAAGPPVRRFVAHGSTSGR